MVTAEHEVSLFNIQDLPPRYAIAFAIQAARQILPLLQKEIGAFGEAALKNAELIAQGKKPIPNNEAPSSDPMSAGSIFQAIASAAKAISNPDAASAPLSEGTSAYEAVYDSAQHVMDYLHKLTSDAHPNMQNSILGMLHEIYDTLMKHHDTTGNDTVDYSIFSNR